MLTIEEAFEKFADELTPTGEQLAEVAQLHDVLREKFQDMGSAVEAIELLNVLVVKGAPRPTFAFVLRGVESNLYGREKQIEGRLLKSSAGAFTVEGQALSFDWVAGVLEPKERQGGGSSFARRSMQLGHALPSLVEGRVGRDVARLGRLVAWALGKPLSVYEVGPFLTAVLGAAADVSGGLAARVRDALVRFGYEVERAVRADHAIALEQEGDTEGAHGQWRTLMGGRWPAPKMPVRGDRIHRVSIQGLRSVEELWLELSGLTVLIGENGSGKSTVVEACELLRRMASPAFLDELHAIHGGLRILLRHGNSELALGVEVRGEDLPLSYEVRLEAQGAGAVITRERLSIGRLAEGAPSIPVIVRDRGRASVVNQFHTLPDGLVLTSFGQQPPHSAIGRMVAALKAIEVHVPFEVTPTWIGRAHGRQSVLRGSSMIQTASGLERLGVNLANAYHALRSDVSEAHWRETMDYVRLGLGERVESVNTRADVAGGAIALWVKLKNRDEQIPAAALSEGTLAYLAFVALFRLPTKRSLLVFDEPELHLHPRLLVRVMSFFQSLADRCPVLLATHSRRILDELRDPAGSAILCELDESNATRLRVPDRAALEAWLEDYEGLGRLLDAGYESEVMVPREGW